jgi:hypothetical protein
MPFILGRQTAENKVFNRLSEIKGLKNKKKRV